MFATEKATNVASKDDEIIPFRANTLVRPYPKPEIIFPICVYTVGLMARARKRGKKQEF
ncbi:MAG: hypothetical protein R3B47_17490 [Bacteroidia bacterium]